MKRILFLFFAAIALQSCNQLPDGFSISGIIEGGSGKIIYLSSTSFTDSVKIGDDNTFHYTGTVPEPDFINLYFDRAKPILLFIDSTEQISINADFASFPRGYKVEGSATSEDICMLQEKLYNTYYEVRTLYDNASQNKDSSKTDSINGILMNQTNALILNHRNEIFDYIRKNPSSFACLPAIYQSFDSRTPLFNFNTDNEYFRLIDSALTTKYPQSKHSREFHSQMIQMSKAQSVQPQTITSPEPGAEAPDFSIPGPDGKSIQLSAFRGKYVLLDFWAAWCTPCRHENPFVVEAWKKFKKKKLVIFQVSLDKDRNAWLTAIEKDGLGEWKHGSDLKYWQSAPAALYGVQGIPANFLIDPKGIIVAKNLRGAELEATLSKYLN